MLRILRMPLLLLFFSLILVSSRDSYAAGDGIQTLIDKLDRLEKDLNGLQKYVFKGKGIKTDSLELEVLPKEMPKSLTARYELKISELSDQMRRIRGSIEELEFKFVQVNERLDALNNYLVSRTDSLNSNLVQNQGSERTFDDSVASESGNLEDLPVVDTTPGYTRQKLGLLQTVEPGGDGINTAPLNEPGSSMDQPIGENNPILDEQFSVEGKTPKEHYDLAIGFIWKKDFDSAGQLLQDFLTRYPNHDLGGNAKYWLGETHYAQKAYSRAAVIFAEGFQNYPASKKAPDILLKLAMSLSQLEKKNEACKTIAILETKFPDSSSHILTRVAEEKTRNSC